MQDAGPAGLFLSHLLGVSAGGWLAATVTTWQSFVGDLGP